MLMHDCLSWLLLLAPVLLCSENLLSRSLTAPLEVLVATPTRLMKVMEHGRVALGDVRW
jgi:hypothetical protein